MMHKLLTAMFFVLLTFSIAPAPAYAAVNAAQDEALLIQKKKKLAALKAAEEKARLRQLHAMPVWKLPAHQLRWREQTLHAQAGGLE
jgi:hypothetical protein